jgi:hypothetical protein
MLCIPLETTFELLPAFFLTALDGACSNLHFTFFLGDFALIEPNKKRKITSHGPIKNISPPLERKRVPWEKMEKDYIKLHIISSKLIRIPRSRNVVVVHILQSIRIGP